MRVWPGERLSDEFRHRVLRLFAFGNQRTPRQDFEFLQFRSVRQEAERYGMPVVMWAYPTEFANADAAGQVRGYAQYDAEAHDVWRVLYERRMSTLRHTGSSVFLEGIERIGLAHDRVPNLTEVNQRLAERTGWAAVGVGGLGHAAGQRRPRALYVTEKGR